MQFLENVLSLFSGKGNDRYIRTPETNNSNSRFFGVFDSAEWMKISGNEYFIYETTPEVSIVFNRFASMFSNGKLIHKKENGTIEGETIEDSEYVRLLEKPNVLQGYEEFLKECALHYLIYGNKITYFNYPLATSNVPTSMFNLPVQNVEIKTTGKRFKQIEKDGIIEKYRLCLNNSADEDFENDEIDHLRFVDPNNPVIGKSVLHALHMPISNIRGAYGYRNVNINKRGALGILWNKSKDSIGSKAPISNDERLKIEKQYAKETHGIFDEQNPIAIMNGEWGFTTTSGAIKDMMLFEEVSEDMKKIIDAIGLNDNIFSKEKSKIQANLSEGLKMAYQDAVIPFAQSFCSSMSKSLRLPDNEWLEMDYSHLEALKEDETQKVELMERKTKAFETLVTNGYSKEEAEEITGLK